MRISDWSSDVCSSDLEGIKESNLDIRQCIERGEVTVEPADSEVVEQEADTHAALGRPAQLIQHDQPGGVALPDVVLDIDRRLGGTDQCDAGDRKSTRLNSSH